MIPNVNPGDRIQASQINPVIDAVNALQQPLGPEPWELLQESFDGDNLPWYVDPWTLSVYRAQAWVRDDPYPVSAYEGDEVSGDFYVWTENLSAPAFKIVDEDQLAQLSGLSQKVYTLYPVVNDQNQGGGPWRVAYHDVRPTFGVSSITSGEGGCSCDLCALTSAEVSASLENPLKIASWTKDNWASQVDVYAPNKQCSCDLSTTLTAGTKIAAWTNDGANWTDIYAPSGGGGGGDCSASISGNVEGSTGTGSQVQIAAGLSCRLSAWSEPGMLSIAVYYL